ncbi:MAG: ABC transporter ATP-binding protein [Ruminococcaceae bacterium]|nr:ABC transporter ATP-binding protein [Oscillospiraceae bacterium]
MIKLNNISFSYGTHEVLKNFNLTVNCGECVQLRGASGSGKTTVARLVLGLENADKGQIVVPQKISTVFQENRLLENHDVQKNIRLVISKDKYKLADNLIKEFNLWDSRKKRVAELSGGMKRRVAIIRAIAYNGDALILDEPFNGLDICNKLIVAKAIKREFIDKNKPVLLITHVKEDAEILNARVINFGEE